MDNNMVIVISAMLINLVLSLVVPCLFKDMNQPLLTQVKQVYNTNKQLILTSTIIVGITTYLALQMYPFLEDKLDSLFPSNNDMDLPFSLNQRPFDANQFRVLLKLNQ
jgi:hypothetical protein